jgi:hypothetical protein
MIVSFVLLIYSNKYRMQTHTWAPASGPDVADIVAIARTHFESEIDAIFTPDPIVYSRNLTRAVIEQFYNPSSEFLQVARDPSGRMIAYVWVIRGQRSPWSDEEMAMPRMVHLDLALSARQRVLIIRQMISMWEAWARANHIPIVCSTTMRRDRDAFLRLHESAGYDVRGSFAYRRLSVQSGPVHPDVLL